MPDAISLKMITTEELTTRAALPVLLTALERYAPTAPTHWGHDDWPRLPYDRDQVLATITDQSTFVFRRRTRPSYAGYLLTDTNQITYLEIEYARDVRDTQLPAIFALADELADQFHPAFGFVHRVWEQDELGMPYSAVVSPNGHKLRTYGPRGPCTRTWFGPHLVDLLGRDALHACSGVTTDLPWGGIMLDLVDQPWSADVDTLTQRQILQELTPTGVFGDYSRRFEYYPGPRWVPIPLE